MSEVFNNICGTFVFAVVESFYRFFFFQIIFKFFKLFWFIYIKNKF
jgi:hypothetical protein